MCWTNISPRYSYCIGFLTTPYWLPHSKHVLLFCYRPIPTFDQPSLGTTTCAILVVQTFNLFFPGEVVIWRFPKIGPPIIQ